MIADIKILSSYDYDSILGHSEEYLVEPSWAEYREKFIKRLPVSKRIIFREFLLLNAINLYVSNNSGYFYDIMNELFQLSTYADSGEFTEELSENLSLVKRRYKNQIEFIVPKEIGMQFIDEHSSRIAEMCALVLVRNRWTFATGRYMGLAKEGEL